MRRFFQNVQDKVTSLHDGFSQLAWGLTQSRSEMELRVADATRSLADKNAELQRANDELQQVNKELEQQRALLIRSGRLAAAGEMAAGIAHEINNPLTTMRNLVFSLGTKLPADDDYQKDIAIVTQEIERINKLIRRFLHYAQPKPSQRATVDLEALLQKTLQLVKPQLRQAGVQARTHFETDVPAIFADAEQIKQVVLNLLLNAVQASCSESSIEVHALPTADGQWVEFSVIDHGVGIAAEIRDQIFLPFFTTKSQGSGLGLAISQRIVEEHGGRIEVSSTVGEGATFVVTLPVGQAAGPDVGCGCARRAR